MKFWSIIKHSNIHMVVPARWFAHNFKKRYFYMVSTDRFSSSLHNGDFQVKITIDEDEITFLAYPNGESYDEQLGNFDKVSYLLSELDGLELSAIQSVLK